MAENRPGQRPHIPRVYDGWVVGKLLEHGPAPYNWDPEESLSYYIKLETWETEQAAQRRREQAEEASRPIDGREPRSAPANHDRGVIVRWGADLKRAIRQSKSGVEIGKIVAAKIVSREPIQTDTPPKRGEPYYKNTWEVETVQFVAQRARFARRINEDNRNARQDGVVGREGLALYMIHEGARRLADLRYPNSEDRKAFLERVKNFLEVSPEREALIAAAAQRISARKPARQPPAERRTPESSGRDPQREPPTRE